MSLVPGKNIRLVRETEQEMVFTHKRLGYVGLVVLGLFLLALPVMATSSFTGGSPWALILPLPSATRFFV